MSSSLLRFKNESPNQKFEVYRQEELNRVSRFQRLHAIARQKTISFLSSPEREENRREEGAV